MRFLVLFFLILVSGCQDNTTNNGSSLIIGTSGDNPPFEFYDTANHQELKGFDIDLAKKIGEKLGRKVVVKDMDFQSLIPALLSKRIDGIAAALTETPERAQRVAFSIPYLTSVPVVVLPRTLKVEAVEDLAALRLGVQTGTNHEQTLKKIQQKFYGQMKLVSMNKLTEMAQELKTGRMDGLITEMDNGSALVEKNADWKYFSLTEYTEPYALAMRKDDPLMVRVNEVLKELNESGFLAELKAKWFGHTKS